MHLLLQRGGEGAGHLLFSAVLEAELYGCGSQLQHQELPDGPRWLRTICLSGLGMYPKTCMLNKFSGDTNTAAWLELFENHCSMAFFF